MRVGYEIKGTSNIHGIGTYSTNLIRELKAQRYANLELVGFDYSEIHAQMGVVDKASKFLMRNMFLTSRDPYWEWFKLPSLAKKNEIDLYHALNGYVPRKTEFKTVMTVHDLAYYYYPDYLRPSTIRSLKTWFKYSARSSDAIIASSENTKKDIVKHWKISEKKIYVVYLGVSKLFFSKREETLIESTLRKYKLPKDYTLTVGQINYRKNIHTLIEAFSIIKKKKTKQKLVLAGKLRKGRYSNEIIELIRKNNLDDDVIVLGRVPFEDLLCLYQGATAFVFPSLYEGFGLPILEAFASGTPVVTSKTSSLGEIARDSASLVDPLKPESIADALLQISEDDKYRKELIEKGKKRVEQFSWVETARKTIDVYSRLVG